MALGAEPGQVTRLFLRQGLALHGDRDCPRPRRRRRVDAAARELALRRDAARPADVRVVGRRHARHRGARELPARAARGTHRSAGDAQGRVAAARCCQQRICFPSLPPMAPQSQNSGKRTSGAIRTAHGDGARKPRTHERQFEETSHHQHAGEHDGDAGDEPHSHRGHAGPPRPAAVSQVRPAAADDEKRNEEPRRHDRDRRECPRGGLHQGCPGTAIGRAHEHESRQDDEHRHQSQDGGRLGRARGRSQAPLAITSPTIEGANGRVRRTSVSSSPYSRRHAGRVQPQQRRDDPLFQRHAGSNRLSPTVATRRMSFNSSASVADPCAVSRYGRCRPAADCGAISFFSTSRVIAV